MQFKKMLSFIVQSITIGLAAAFVILLLRSHLSVDQPTIATGAGAKPSDTFFSRHWCATHFQTRGGLLCGCSRSCDTRRRQHPYREDPPTADQSTP